MDSIVVALYRSRHSRQPNYRGVRLRPRFGRDGGVVIVAAAVVIVEQKVSRSELAFRIGGCSGPTPVDETRTVLTWRVVDESACGSRGLSGACKAGRPEPAGRASSRGRCSVRLGALGGR